MEWLEAILAGIGGATLIQWLMKILINGRHIRGTATRNCCGVLDNPLVGPMADEAVPPTQAPPTPPIATMPTHICAHYTISDEPCPLCQQVIG